MWKTFMEFLLLSGAIGVLGYLAWSKVAMGAILTLIGAFFPKHSGDEAKGESHITWDKFTIGFTGSLRVAVAIAGILIIIIALVEAVKKQESEKPEPQPPKFLSEDRQGRGPGDVGPPPDWRPPYFSKDLDPSRQLPPVNRNTDFYQFSGDSQGTGPGDVGPPPNWRQP